MIFIVGDVIKVRDFFISHRKVQRSEIQVNIARILGSRNHRHVHVDGPAKNHLGRNEFVMAGDLQDQSGRQNGILFQTMEINPMSACKEQGTTVLNPLNRRSASNFSL